jgi:U4/U6 small nuclear ribonucleoprotein PRP4
MSFISELQLSGHVAQAGCAKFHPSAYLEEMPFHAASCDHDGRVLLWGRDCDEPMTELEKHPARVSRLAFHPSGKFLATCW